MTHPLYRRLVNVAIIALLTPWLATTPSFAAPSNDAPPPPHVSARIINDQTGEVTQLETTQTVSVRNGKVTVTVDAESAPSLVSPMREGGSTAGTKDISAAINVDYDLRASGQEVRLNRVWGSWTKKTSQISIWSREVHYGDQNTAGHVGHKYPTANSYSYTTGWGWVEHDPQVPIGGAGGRAFSSAKYGISGMATFTIEVLVTF